MNKLFMMSVTNFSLLTGVNVFRSFLKATSVRHMSSSAIKCCSENKAVDEGESETPKQELTAKQKALDRTKVILVETSIRYLKSKAYKETYGEYLVWEQYRRNHKGMYPPLKTRKTCIRKGMISTGNPCPICRDEYLVLDHRNVDLLKQFISPHSGGVLSYSKTGVCQKKHKDLLVAVEKARDSGYLTFDVPFREFNYSEYYNEKHESKN